MAWNDDKRALAVTEFNRLISEYPEDERSRYSVEVLAKVAAHPDIAETVNGTRTILNKADAWIKPVKATKAATAEGTKRKAPNKAEAIAGLFTMFEANGAVFESEDDKAALEKMTGKAAVILTDLLSQVLTHEED